MESNEEKVEMLSGVDANESEENKIPVAVFSKRPWYYINPGMIPCKTGYFFLMAKELLLRMNIVLFCTSIGLSKSQAGFVAGLRLIGGLVGAPFWGFIADKYHNHRKVLLLLCVVATLFTAAQVSIAYKFGNESTNQCRLSTPKNTSVVDMKNSTNSTSSFDQTEKSSFTEKDQIILFVLMFVVNLIQSFFDGGLDAFVDLGTIQRIKNANSQEGAENHTFGWQRIWGSGGVIVGPVLGNFVIDNFPEAKITCYAGIFIIFVVINFFYVLSLERLFKGLNLKEDEIEESLHEEEQRVKKKKTFSILRKQLFQFNVIFFITTLLILGIMLSQLTVFTFPYMKDLNSSTQELNLSIIVTSVAGGIGFLISNRVLKMIGGHWQALALSLTSFFFRFMMMALTKNPSVIIAAQVFDIFAGSMSEFASVNFVDITFSKSVLGSMYGLVNSVQFSLADIVGSSVGGIIYEEYGGSVLYLIFSIISSIFCILVLVYLLVTGALCKSKKEKKANIELK